MSIILGGVLLVVMVLEPCRLQKPLQLFVLDAHFFRGLLVVGRNRLRHHVFHRAPPFGVPPKRHHGRGQRRWRFHDLGRVCGRRRELFAVGVSGSARFP